MKILNCTLILCLVLSLSTICHAVDVTTDDCVFIKGGDPATSLPIPGEDEGDGDTTIGR